MSDNTDLKSPQDSNLISLKEDWEVKYWSTSLGISVLDLVEAVKKAGHSVKAVKKYLHEKNEQQTGENEN